MNDPYKRRREIIRLYEEVGLTFSDIGEIMGTSKQRIHQLYHSAIAKRNAVMRPTPRHFLEKAYNWEKIKRDIEVALRGGAR